MFWSRLGGCSGPIKIKWTGAYTEADYRSVCNSFRVPFGALLVERRASTLVAQKFACLTTCMDDVRPHKDFNGIHYDSKVWAGLGNVLISKEFDKIKSLNEFNCLKIKTLPRPSQLFM
jgi:hypothetical protein